jgi:hypothetical protein
MLVWLKQEQARVEHELMLSTEVEDILYHNGQADILAEAIERLQGIIKSIIGR